MTKGFPILTPEQAAALVKHNETVGFGGFTAAGACKVIPLALAERAKAEHAAGRPFKLGVLTGASTGKSLDGALAAAEAIAWRTPYQSDPTLRKAINEGKTKFFDLHLSAVQPTVRSGVLGKVNWAIVEASRVTPEGEITLSTSVGCSNTYVRMADHVLIELNAYHPAELTGFHDLYEPADPPHRREIPIYAPTDRVGSTVIKVDPKKIAGIVHTNKPDESGGFDAPDPVTTKIGENVAKFLVDELRVGRIPASFLPLQSGVGNIANAVIGALGSSAGIPPFMMYTEVIQDSVIDLIEKGKCTFASGCSLTVSPAKLQQIYKNLEYYRSRIVLRPQEISNSPELVRRLGLITINTAIEVDLFGNVNSTHVMGKDLMNGIGGSGDFTRNAHISIYTCPSVAKKGAISTIVPFVTHLDHSEHSVQVVVTEHGIADLRGKAPHERAMAMIENCVHPEYRQLMKDYLTISNKGHVPQTLQNAFGMHQAFLQTGDMRNTKWLS
ncbi:succinate CoA transferase [Opitutus sp. ER46]|uniref:succinate CoA transferase n=1 Tax=Opitutus sp. ER46 TaxID=2161864 RepID=UPI000D2FBA97|nr:succinate CoA transferase [Opitutus sp. ER46]PTY00498.1 acetyl-CoA hydrolase [Opitutus sp. ER46]